MWTLTNVLFLWRWLKLQYNSKNSIVPWSSLGYWRTFKMPFNFWARRTFLNNTVVRHSLVGVSWKRVSAAVYHWVFSFWGITLTTIFPIFLLASMCRWASAMCSRLNILSITGLKEPVWSEKCGSTLCEKAFTRSALYWGGRVKALSYQDANRKETCRTNHAEDNSKSTGFSHDLSQTCTYSQKWADLSFLAAFSHLEAARAEQAAE